MTVKDLSRLVLALCLFTLPAAALPQARNVQVVSPGSGALQTSIDAAAEGDVLLLRAGAWGPLDSVSPPITIDGHSLILQAAKPAQSEIRRLRVQNLTASQSVVLRGIDLDHVELVDCAGPVMIERAEVFQLYATDSECILRDCSVLPIYLAQRDDPYAEVTITRGAFFAYDTTIYGEGNSGFRLANTPLRLSGTTAFLEGGEVRATLFGGFSGVCPPAIGMGATHLTVRDMVIAGCDGPTGGQTFTTLPGTTRRLLSATPKAESQDVTLRFQGSPGDMVWLARSEDLAPNRPFPVVQSWYHGSWGPTSVLFLGVLDASGELAQTYQVPSLPLMTPVQAHLLQGYFFSSGGTGQLSAPTLIQLYDGLYGQYFLP